MPIVSIFFFIVDTKNSVGLVGCIEEIAHNAIAIYWNPLESPAKVLFERNFPKIYNLNMVFLDKHSRTMFEYRLQQSEGRKRFAVAFTN